MGGGEGKEGDWYCGGCGNRNYAFRSFCNRCRKARLLVDSNTPADSKWLPRIGDWICTGCTNNNYASREKCKKCGQPKEVAAMPALAMPGASLQTHPHYFARVQGVHHQGLNFGSQGNGALQQSLPLRSNWLLGVPDKFAVQPASTWPLGGNLTNTVSYPNQVSQVTVPKGWRNGDWICACGFHNYSSRAQCKKCNASMPPALGTKRLASEELVQDWDNKRLNAGQTLGLLPAYPTPGHISSSSYSAPGQMVSSATNQTVGVYQPYPDGSLQHNLQFPLPQLTMMPTLPGKGWKRHHVRCVEANIVCGGVERKTGAKHCCINKAKQWRDGDWMCTNCNNHNYASRSHCNKCNTQREGLVPPVSVS